jgi:hypothetical protein
MQQAMFCDFGDQKEENIRDQVIDKCKSLLLRKSFLEKREITLTQLQDLARAKETAERQAKSMEKSAETNIREVNSLRDRSYKATQRPRQQNTNTEKPGKCFRCGRDGHYAKTKFVLLKMKPAGSVQKLDILQ